jgi:hypothetical protein
MMVTGIGYAFYNKMMLVSISLDENELIWKRVKQRRKYKRKR